MPIDLPQPLKDYFSAVNSQDIDAMLAPFAMEAMVKDEGATMNGRAAIRAWIEETTRKYGVSLSPEGIDRDGDRVSVRVLMSGNFPGSPAHVTYRFILRGGEIGELEIG